jgi:hypothetical protein
MICCKVFIANEEKDNLQHAPGLVFLVSVTPFPIPGADLNSRFV